VPVAYAFVAIAIAADTTAVLWSISPIVAVIAAPFGSSTAVLIAGAAVSFLRPVAAEAVTVRTA
jgi:hypothetical protein